MRELPSGGVAERTTQNVADSDATIIIHDRELTGGTAETERVARQIGKPLLLVNAAELIAEIAAGQIAEFVRQDHVATLNVAGPRESEWPGGYEFARSVLTHFFRCARDLLHCAGS